MIDSIRKGVIIIILSVVTWIEQ